MKTVIKKILKTILLFISSTIIIYFMFVISAFYNWCVENQMFVNSDTLLSELKREKIQELGDSVGNYASLLEDSIDKSDNKANSDEHSLAEYYNPLGYSVWAHIQGEVREIWSKYTVISILSGISIAIAYIIITSKNMNKILKFVLGYFGVMLVIPPIYMYSWTYTFCGIIPTYQSMPKYFYIGYTIFFGLMYVINYKIGTKMTKELNENIKKLDVK